jgi:hypothetical protein
MDIQRKKLLGNYKSKCSRAKTEKALTLSFLLSFQANVKKPADFWIAGFKKMGWLMGLEPHRVGNAGASMRVSYPCQSSLFTPPFPAFIPEFIPGTTQLSRKDLLQCPTGAVLMTRVDFVARRWEWNWKMPKSDSEAALCTVPSYQQFNFAFRVKAA